MHFLLIALASIVPLWPSLDQMPDAQTNLQFAAMTDVSKAPGFNPNEHRMPYLEWCEPPAETNRTGACMILISGGGYWSLCDVDYIEMFRQAFTAWGVQCVKLIYRTPRPEGIPYYKTAWDDGQRAVRLVRREAAARGFDPDRIGAIGISAGANLTTLLATSSLTPAYPHMDDIDDIPCNINWAVTGAIAYGLTDGPGLPNSRDGDAPDVKLNPAFQFDANTCPMCMLQGGADIYSPFASTMVYRKLREMKIPAELHLFADRPHALWDEDSDWFAQVSGFMRQMNFDRRLGEEVDVMTRFPSDTPGEKVVKLNVWPEGKMPSLQTNQCTPWIEWHIPTNLTTKSIQLIYSGGGYFANGPGGFEVAPAQRYLNQKGMACVVMKYRTPRPLPESGLQKHVTAWQDLQRAIRLIKRDAPKYGLDPNSIGIMGSSAGGHLTLMGATSSKHRSYWPIDDVDEKYDPSVRWAVAIYPAYALTDGIDQPNTTRGNADWARLVPEFSFDLATCPILFIHGDADGWASMNSVKTWEQLRRMGIQGELHTFALRNHCFQKTSAPGTSSYNWLDRIWEFMNHKGYNK